MNSSPVLLVNPPSPPDCLAARDAAAGMGAWLDPSDPPAAPLTLAHCAAALREAGWEPQALDAATMSETEAMETIAARPPALVVALASPTTAPADTRFLAAMRAQLPDTRTLLVSQAARFLPPALGRAAAGVLVGEPEGAIVAACRYALAQAGPIGPLTPRQLDAPRYDAQGHLLDLASLPAPTWDLFPVEQYGALPILAGRGCGLGCRYCPVPPTQGTLARWRAGEQLAHEMQALNRRHGVRAFRLVAPVFAADRLHAEALCAALTERGLASRVVWQCESRPEALDLPLLRAMSRAGCRTLHLGVESVSPQTLIAIGRVADERAAQRYLMRVQEILLGCRAFDIACHLHVMGGLPGDRAGAAATRTFLRAYAERPRAVHVHPLTPYPGTTIFPTNQLHLEQRLLATAQPPPSRLSVAAL